jgi:hypothetical protein
VGLNDGETSYYRFSYAGFYGDEQADWAYITFDPSLNGKKVRVSYAAPINMSLVWSGWGDKPLPQQFSMYSCLSDFDQNLPPNPLTDDTPENWITQDWDSRDIWYVALYQMVDYLEPRYIDIEHCEQLIMHTDWRCREDRKTTDYSSVERYPGQMRTWEHNAWICGHEIEFLRQTIADIDDDLGGNAQMMTLADMFDSHNGQYAEGRCRWNWYEENTIDEYHQPDSDDPNWVGNVESHIYYQPAMGGMGGWTWDEREDPDGLTSNYGMMASDYVNDKDSLVMWEWGYQAGYFDDRDPEHIITWQDKFEERYRDLALQDFTSFVGGCAGYALGLEGGDWGGIRFRFRDESSDKEKLALVSGNEYFNFNQLDGSNLKWVQMNYHLSGLSDESVDIDMFLEAYNWDPVYSTEHKVGESGKGCHLGTVQDGLAFADDVVVIKDGQPLDIYNLNFEDDFPTPGDTGGYLNWYPTKKDYDLWERNPYQPKSGSYCCKFLIDKSDYSYSSTDDQPRTFNERHPIINQQANSFEFSVWLKTIKLDALRHLNVKSWMDLTYNYQPQDKILGMTNTQWGDVRNYSSEPTSADWMWLRNYPASPLIKYMYYDPFYMFMGDRATHPNGNYPPNAPYPQDVESISEQR